MSTLSYEAILNLATAASGGALALTCFALVSIQWALWKVLGLTTISAVLIIIGIACLYLRQQRPCDSLCWSGFKTLALLKLSAVTVGRYAVWKLRRAYKSRSAMRNEQEKALMKTVKQSRDTVFGRDHKFSQIRGIEDYRANVPVRDYADLDKYNQLAYRGEPNVFFPGPTEFLAKTSGTTGKNKTFPASKKFLMRLLSVYMTCLYSFERFFSRNGRKSCIAPKLMMSVHPVDRKNEFGVPVGPISKMYGSQGPICTTPIIAFQNVHDAKTGFYIHAVFALWHKRISDVDVFFPTSLITFMRCLSTNWSSILKDIETGRLSPEKVDLDAELINQLNQHLTPKPERAAQLRAMFGDGQDLSGFFEKAWPDVSCVFLVRSGSFQASYRYLKKFFGTVPALGSIMAGTEGIVGCNMLDGVADLDSTELYHPFLGPSFVEFIQVDADGNDVGEPCLAHELQVGNIYETVLTSYNCFRLRSGDVIRVEKMDNCAPVFELSHRKSHVLTVHVEKTTEKSLQACVMLAAERLGCQVVDFTAADCYLYEIASGSSLGTKYYAMFVELDLDGDRRLSETDKLLFDQALRDSSENYNLFRSEGNIDQMQVLQVRKGGFAALRQEMMTLNKDVSEVQFKTPRVLKGEGQVKCLLGHLA